MVISYSLSASFSIQTKCCNVRQGNGHCNGAEYNTEECNWDGGDCLDVKLDGCDDPERRHFLLGDDYCHGFMNTPECNFDGGDCLKFLKRKVS